MLPIRRACSRPHAASVPLVAGMLSDFEWPRRCGADWESTKRSQFRYPTCNSQVLTCPGTNRRKVFKLFGRRLIPVGKIGYNKPSPQESPLEIVQNIEDHSDPPRLFVAVEPN